MGTETAMQAVPSSAGRPAIRTRLRTTGQDLSNDVLERQPVGFEDIYE